jgi:hypothetical protein
MRAGSTAAGRKTASVMTRGAQAACFDKCY